jgi:hypothetical protein
MIVSAEEQQYECEVRRGGRAEAGAGDEKWTIKPARSC